MEHRLAEAQGRPGSDAAPQELPEEAAAAELHEQFQSLLDTIWRAEADWRFMDRLGLDRERSRPRGQR